MFSKWQKFRPVELWQVVRSFSLIEVLSKSCLKIQSKPCWSTKNGNFGGLFKEYGLSDKIKTNSAKLLWNFTRQGIFLEKTIKIIRFSRLKRDLTVLLDKILPVENFWRKQQCDQNAKVFILVVSNHIWFYYYYYYYVLFRTQSPKRRRETKSNELRFWIRVDHYPRHRILQTRANFFTLLLAPHCLPSGSHFLTLLSNSAITRSFTRYIRATLVPCGRSYLQAKDL